MHTVFARMRPSPAMAISLVALFVAFGGTTYAATGGTFILGRSNSATTQTTLTANRAGKALQVTNTSTGTGATALGLTVATTKPPFTTNSSVKVTNLNADKLDNLTSTDFVRRGVDQSVNVTAAGGVVSVTNTGTTNGVQAKTSSEGASGVYGENTSGYGYGVAGRAGSNGHAVYGDNTGTGYAGYFEDKVFVGGALECNGCVDGADVTGQVGDSAKLGGVAASGYARAEQRALAESPNAHQFMGAPMLGFLRLSYACPGTLTDLGFLHIYNDSGNPANVFIDSGTANPSYTPLAAGGEINLPASATGDSWFIQAQGGPGVMTIQVASVHRATDCHVQALATLAQ